MANASDPSVTLLPAFDNPPVVETVLSAQFEPFPSLTNGQLGAFWHNMRNDWPTASDAPRSNPEIESFGGAPFWPPMLQFRIGQDPSSRLQLHSADNSRMMQIENGRISYNWLAQEGKSYPHFNQIKPAFDAALRQFSGFLEAEEVGDPKMIQWEVTYVNRLPKGTVWQEPKDWSGLFRHAPFALTLGGALPTLESFNGSWHFEIVPRRGRLHIEIQHGKSAPPNSKELLALKLTARGPINSENSLDDGLNLGHAIIVQAFTDMTSNEAHSYWRRSR